MDVKEVVMPEVLEGIGMPIDWVFREIALPVGTMAVADACIIDLFDAREACCGENYRAVMDRWLPEGQQLEALKELLKNRGVEK